MTPGTFSAVTLGTSSAVILSTSSAVTLGTSSAVTLGATATSWLNPMLAHGVGSRGDLPLPLWQFAWAAMAALVISFVMLGAAWKQPRLAHAAPGITVTAPAGQTQRVGLATIVARAVGVIVRMVGLGLYVLVMVAALMGRNDSAINIAPVAIYVVLWVGVSVFSAVIVNPWPWASPFDTIIAGVDRFRSPEESAPAPPWSLWFAPLGAFGFLMMELIVPTGADPKTLGIAMVVYSIVALGGGVRWGRSWLRQAETFAVLCGLLGAIAPFGVDDAGRVHLRWPFTGLGILSTPAPWTATALVVLGGTSFDGFAESTMGKEIFTPLSDTLRVTALAFTLCLSIALVAGLFLFATRSAASRTEVSWGSATASYTSSLVPIVLGYLIAHYAQLLVDETQTFIFRLSDPFGWGWNVLGTANNTIDYSLISVNAIAWVQALAIVGGHIAAVIVAHDRALEIAKPDVATRSQYAMLVVMVIYSVGGLWLLFNA